MGVERLPQRRLRWRRAAPALLNRRSACRSDNIRSRRRPFALSGTPCKPLVWVYRHVACRLLANWIEAKHLACDEADQKVSGFRPKRLLHFGGIDERKAKGNAFDQSLTIGMLDVRKEAIAVEHLLNGRLQDLVGACWLGVIGDDDHASLSWL